MYLKRLIFHEQVSTWVWYYMPRIIECRQRGTHVYNSTK
jgi:hypothetical protein